MTIIKRKLFTFDELKEIRDKFFKMEYMILTLSCDNQGNYTEILSSLDYTHNIEITNNSPNIIFTFFDEVRVKRNVKGYLSKIELDIFGEFIYKLQETEYIVFFESVEERNIFLRENVIIVYSKLVREPYKVNKGDKYE